MKNSTTEEFLICFTGMRDPRPDFGVPGCSGEKENGPILSLINHKKFDKAFLLCTSDNFMERGTQIKIECSGYKEMPEIILLKLETENVIDYIEIYRKLAGTVSALLKKYGNKNIQWNVLLDPGTPQMQTSWILLVQSGLFNAKMIQGIPPEYNNGVYSYRYVDLSDTALPVISKPPELKIKETEESVQSAGTPAENEKYNDFEKAVKSANLVIRDNNTLKIFRQAWTVARHDHIHHLILGETGTGKTELAKWIHKCGPRADKPFQTLNCATLTPESAESTLFGHKKGAYTGAEYYRPGFLKTADKGILFLDEIGDLSLELQAKLLHVLDDGSFYPMGSDNREKVDVVIIAATNKNLEKMVEQKEFREDLYSRLATVPLVIPPIRERPADVEYLINKNIQEWNRRKNDSKFLSDTAFSILIKYPWPRNIRELKQVITRICMLSIQEEIRPEDLPQEILSSAGENYKSRIPSVTLPEEGIRLREYLADIEREFFRQALEKSKGNMTKAAALVGWEGHAFRKAVKTRYPDLLINT